MTVLLCCPVKGKNFPAVTAARMQQIDRVAIEQYGISSLVLMENAGVAVAQAVLASGEDLAGKRIGIFCGTGNNGGDGFVAARHLLNAGCRVGVFLVGKEAELKPDAAVNCRILQQSGCWVTELSDSPSRIRACCRRFGLMVDAIFGVGLNRDIAGRDATLVEAMNSSGVRVVAVDIPSGLDATTGVVRGICIRAFKTVTFSVAKKGFFVGAGPQVTGQVVVADIGIPKNLVSRMARRAR